MSINIKFNWRIFRKFLFPYILLLFIPIVIGSVAYYISYSAMLKQSEELSSSMMKQSQQIFENDLSTIGNLMESQLGSIMINQFAQVKNPYDSKQIGKVIDMNLYYAKTSNDYGLSFKNYLIFTKSNLCISSENNCYIDTFYNHIFRLKNQSFDEFYNMISEQYYYRKFLPVQDAVYRGADTRAFVCLYSIGQLRNQEGAILVVINENYINSVFENIISLPDTQLMIYDHEKVLLYQSNHDFSVEYSKIETQLKDNTLAVSDIEGKSVYIANIVSVYNKWQYVFIQPTEMISAKAKNILTYSLMMSATILLIGIFMAAFMALRNTRIITSLSKSLENEAALDSSLHYGPFTYLKSGIKKLLDDKITLEKMTSRQAELIQAAFMSKMLNGSCLAPGENEIAAQSMGIPLKANAYGVAIFSLSRYQEVLSEEILKELSGRRLLLSEYIHHSFDPCAILHDISHRSIAGLFYTQSSSSYEFRKDLKTKLENFCLSLPKLLQNSVTIAVGRLYTEIDHVSRSYGEAEILTLNNRYIPGSAVFWYDEASIELGGFFYSAEIENRLISVVKSGSYDKTLDLLATIYRENFKLKDISSRMLDILIADMLSTAIRLISQNPIQDHSANEIWDLINQSQIDAKTSFSRIIKPVFLNLCSMMLEQKERHTGNLVKSMLEHIDHHYMDQKLSLTTLAEKYSLSEVYISQFFKEHVGENFFSHLEKTRIAQAKLLLINSDMQIQKIAGHVGYQSSNSFCRAFKRVTSMNAGEYRVHHQIN